MKTTFSLAKSSIADAEPAAGRAFTLVELLAVLAILTLLALTLVPTLAGSRTDAKAFVCQNNNRQLCLAWRMYADDNNGRIVYASDDNTAPANPFNAYAWTLTHMDFSDNPPNWDPTIDIMTRPLWPYTAKDASVYKCPSDTSAVYANGAMRPRVRSFSVNFYLGGFAGSYSGNTFAIPYRLFMKTTDLTAPGPANTFVFIDEAPQAINWGNFLTQMDGYPNQPSLYKFNDDFPGTFHNFGASVSFADGRAEIHRWVDPRSAPQYQYPFPSGTVASPNNADVAWLQAHATAPR